MKELRIKRIYEAIEEQDGYRVLTDRLWPRGIAKAKAAIDLWEKTVAPSTELREWLSTFGRKLLLLQQNLGNGSGIFLKGFQSSQNAICKNLKIILTQPSLLNSVKNNSKRVMLPYYMVPKMKFITKPLCCKTSLTSI